MTGTARPPSDRGALSGPLAGASFIAGVAGAMALADDPYPRPGSEPAQVRRYFGGNAGPARLSAAGQAVSAASLVGFTASVTRLAGRSGRGSRALQAAAVAGGGLAAGSLAAAAGYAAALTGPAGDSDAGAALALLGRREEAVEHLVAAHRTARRLGARPLVERVTGSLAALGEQAERRLGRRAAAQAANSSLTRREVEVVRLVAMGHTNREIARELFLSPRTVEMHVGSILLKLDCRSRADAARRASELGLLGVS